MTVFMLDLEEELAAPNPLATFIPRHRLHAEDNGGCMYFPNPIFHMHAYHTMKLVVQELGTLDAPPVFRGNPPEDRRRYAR